MSRVSLKLQPADLVAVDSSIVTSACGSGLLSVAKTSLICLVFIFKDGTQIPWETDSSGGHVKRVTEWLLVAELLLGKLNSAHALPVQPREKFWREDTR